MRTPFPLLLPLLIALACGPVDDPDPAPVAPSAAAAVEPSTEYPDTRDRDGAPREKLGNPSDEQLRACSDAGGRWGWFPDTCGDDCANKARLSPCGSAITYGCDCPTSQCLDEGAGRCRAITCEPGFGYDLRGDACMPCDPTTEICVSAVGLDTSLGAGGDSPLVGRRDPFEAAAHPEDAPLHTSTESRSVRRCRDGGGVWGSFGNTCGDTCGYKEQPDLCGDAITKGCDCPRGQCFDTAAGFCRAITCPADRQYDAEEDRCALCDPPCHRLPLTPCPELP